MRLEGRGERFVRDNQYITVFMISDVGLSLHFLFTGEEEEISEPSLMKDRSNVRMKEVDDYYESKYDQAVAGCPRKRIRLLLSRLFERKKHAGKREQT